MRNFRESNIIKLLCIANGALTTYPWGPHTLTFSYNLTSQIGWNQAPPSTAVVNTNYNASVFGTWNGTVSWSVAPFGGVATTTGSNSANLLFFTSGVKTVTATATDICTGQTSSISKQVNVQ